MRVHEMSGDTGSAKYMFIMAHDWIFDDIGTNTTVHAGTNSRPTTDRQQLYSSMVQL